MVQKKFLRCPYIFEPAGMPHPPAYLSERFTSFYFKSFSFTTFPYFCLYNSINWALISDETIEIKDKELLQKFEVIQNMSGETKKTVVHLIDLVNRDFKTKQAYAS